MATRVLLISCRSWHDSTKEGQLSSDVTRMQLMWCPCRAAHRGMPIFRCAPTQLIDGPKRLGARVAVGRRQSTMKRQSQQRCELQQYHKRQQNKYMYRQRAPQRAQIECWDASTARACVQLSLMCALLQDMQHASQLTCACECCQLA